MNTVCGETSPVSESTGTRCTQQLPSCKLRSKTHFFCFGKWPRSVLTARSRAASAHIAVSGATNCLNCWGAVFVVQTQYKCGRGLYTPAFNGSPRVPGRSIHTCQGSSCQYADVTRNIRLCGAEKWIRIPKQQPLFYITSAPDALMWLNHRSSSRESISLSATSRSLNRSQLNAGGFLQSKPFWPASHYHGQFTLAPHGGRTWNDQALTIRNKHGIFISWHKSFDMKLYYRLNTEYFGLAIRYTPSLQYQSPARTITTHITTDILAVSTVT